MMTELVLVEGVSDVQLISYFLQKVYEWKHEYSNRLGIVPLGTFISKVDWSKSNSLKELFKPFMYLGRQKP